jgi:hypothetical protein
MIERKLEKIVTPSFLLLLLTLRYNGWFDAIRNVWMAEGTNRLFKGSVSRIAWYIPASALTFRVVEFLREHFNDGLNNAKMPEVTSLSIDQKRSSLEEGV